MEQTAVEQLKQEFFGYADPYSYFSEEDKWVITEREFLELIKKSKEIEKEQNKKSYYTGAANNWNNFDEYYNEIYKNK